jgi:hypothetical protein
VKKLGIKPKTTLALLRPPDGFRQLLVALPDDVRVVSRADAADLVVWFITRRGELDAGIAGIAKAMGAGLWISWPKKASGVKTDLNENVIRDAGLAHGLVDYKVCAIDATWSGLKFARRR